MIKIYYSNQSIEYGKYLKYIGEKRLKHIMEYKQDSSREKMVLASLLLDYAASINAPSVNRPLDILIALGGKPYVDGFMFNLSHSGDYAVCAMSPNHVGVDIEQCKKSILEVASKIDEGNIDYVLLTKIWTTKEAYLKLTGEGLKKYAIDIVIPDNVYIKSFKIDNYYLSVASYFDEEVELISTDICNIYHE